MATNTRNKANAPTPDAPAETDTPAESTEVPATDTPTETVAPTLPDSYTPEHPLVRDALEAVIQAEEHKDDPTPVLDFVTKADELFNLPTGFDVVANLPGTDMAPAIRTYNAFKAVVDTLRDRVELADRDEWDQVINGLVALANTPRGGISSEADKEAIPIIAARWAATEPKGAKGSGTGKRGPRGTSDIPKLQDVWGFKSEYQIRSKCDICGTEHTTRKDNLNSQRDALIGHRAQKCPTKANIGNGTQAYAEVTKSLYSLGLGDSDYKGKHVDRDKLLDKSEGGGWTHTVVKS